MKKIAILSYYSGIVDRGVETFVLEISKRLAREMDLTVFSGGRQHIQKYKTRQIKSFKIKPKSAKGILGKLYIDKQSLYILIFTILTIPKLIVGKYDLILPVNGGWQIAIIKILSFFTKSKVIVTGHAGIGSDDAWNILWRPDIFVALTSAQAAWAKRLADDLKVTVIPNGVDLHRFNPKIAPFKITLAKPIVICASALVPYKRLDLTIRAVAKTTNLSLLVIGEGELQGSIDSLGKRLLGARYQRIVVPHEKIPQYYRAGKLFTLASTTEAFGISYVEAMACNLPIVTTKDKSRAEIIGDAGILVNTQNINRYTKALSYVARADFKNKPYSRALKFSWNKIAQKYFFLINSTIESK